ncbi:YkuS family protein [Clostridiaceae bacterium UIB06]|uniref:YkuS family protein n=1 Tax=Clostridium thailandense TaxID=2794346 RepID=A0A949TQS7_9CLOT|nr:YkuS family protein [Clostridium thailandense]MBV7274847.1 YkuS family protein [Clostridium thailandense]MCH5137592.1 YkuS family protein [Clostridiaceae bacterium UIB06]
MKKVAVEKGLGDVEQYLSNQGYSVREFEMNSIENSKFYDQFDAVVVTGGSVNVMGYEDTKTKVPQIIADGLTAEEIKREIDNKSIR